ncbi:hypothetical protein Tco_0759938 [Tanacetum coccineum]
MSCCGITCADTMGDMNIHAKCSAEQAPAIAPPTRTDDQILPSSKWVPIGKSNCIFSENALDITPPNDNNPFVAMPSSDVVIEYVNTLGYPSTLRNVSAMSVNALYQPWRAILSMINMCLTGKTAGYDRPRHHVATLLQFSWKEEEPIILLIPNVRYVGKDGREIFGMPIPDALLTDALKSAPYYISYLEHVIEYQRKSVMVMNQTFAPSPAKRTKAGKVTKKRMPKSSLQLVDEVVDEGVPEKEPAHDDEEEKPQRALSYV